MHEVRVSFIIATCNGAQFIEEQLKSITTCLGPDDEIVICDDASDDNTIAVLEKFVDERIKLFKFDERVGYQKNFERAAKRARGQFIFFSDQDDVCLPLRIPNSLDALRTKGCVFGDVIVVDQDLRILEPSYFKWRGFSDISVVRMIIKPMAIGAAMACTKEFLKQSIPFPANVPHDHWLSCLAAFKGELGVIEDPVIKYRRHPSAVSETGRSSQRLLKVILWERTLLLFSLVIRLISGSKVYRRKRGQ